MHTYWARYEQNFIKSVMWLDRQHIVNEYWCDTMWANINIIKLAAWLLGDCDSRWGRFKQFRRKIIQKVNAL